jgi:hypothetical protein
MLSSAKEEKMPKLTDSQLMVLSKAAAREDGVAVVPRGMNKAAAAKVGSSLVTRKLMREIRSKPGMSIWREENGRNVSLVITRIGRDAIGVENDTAESDRSAAKKTGVAVASERGSIDDAPRPGSKQALIVEMLQGSRRIARYDDRSDRLVAPFDQGRADRAPQTGICRRTDPPRDQRLTLSDCP